MLSISHSSKLSSVMIGTGLAFTPGFLGADLVESCISALVFARRSSGATCGCWCFFCQSKVVYGVIIATHLDHLTMRRKILVEQILKLDSTWTRSSSIGGSNTFLCCDLSRMSAGIRYSVHRERTFSATLSLFSRVSSACADLCLSSASTSTL
jgi:hypothetical protein